MQTIHGIDGMSFRTWPGTVPDETTLPYPLYAMSLGTSYQILASCLRFPHGKTDGHTNVDVTSHMWNVLREGSVQIDHTFAVFILQKSMFYP